jgi:hypothetical protein
MICIFYELSMINNGFMLRILQKPIIRDVINNLKSMK